jgi:hypothetical protein
VNQSQAAGSAPRRFPSLLVGAIILALAAIGAGRAYELSASSSIVSASPRAMASQAAAGTRATVAAPPGQIVPSLRHDAIGEADGVIPAGTTVFDDEIPGVGKLNRALLVALQRAARDAARDGVAFVVNSGWRSAAYQEQLLGDAIEKYGSKEKAARWVGTPATSAHVSGDAVDIGPSDAETWLSKRGAAYGLCQIYRNEPWHYELRPAAVDHGCPAMYADPSHDPRMQR